MHIHLLGPPNLPEMQTVVMMKGKHALQKQMATIKLDHETLNTDMILSVCGITTKQNFYCFCIGERNTANQRFHCGCIYKRNIIRHELF